MTQIRCHELSHFNTKKIIKYRKIGNFKHVPLFQINNKSKIFFYIIKLYSYLKYWVISGKLMNIQNLRYILLSKIDMKV